MRNVIVVFAVLFGTATLNAGLVNRYSFTTDASDSVGSKNGTLQGTATVSGGALQLDGSGYASLPTGIVSSLSSFTIETWVTESATSPNWSRVFDFGSGTPSYLFLSLDPGATKYVWLATKPTSGSSETVVSDFSTNNTYVQHQVAVTYDDMTTTVKLYYDAALLASGVVSTAPSLMGATTQNYLGKSQFAGDGNFIGSINEFRIYNNALSAAAISADGIAGPNALTSTPEPASFGMIGLGVVSLGLLSKRKR